MLTPEREQEIRGQVDYGEDAGYTSLGWERAARDLLAEIDRLRAELAELVEAWKTR